MGHTQNKNKIMETLKSLVGKDEESLHMKDEWFTSAHAGDIEKMNEIYNKMGFLLHINSKDKDGNTAVHHAIMGYHIEAATWLIDHGAHFDKKNKEKKTPYDLAMEMKDMSLVNFLEMHRTKAQMMEAWGRGAAAAGASTQTKM